MHGIECKKKISAESQTAGFGWIDCFGNFYALHLHRRNVRGRDGSGDGFYQKESGAVYAVSVWNRLAWKEYAGKNTKRLVGQHSVRRDFGRDQRIDRIDPWSCFCNNGEDGGCGCFSFCIDWIMGVPHILLLILISVALGKGLRGVAVGIALTHWPSLARVIRAEVLQLRESPYIQIAEKLGKSKGYLVRKHMLPHLLPQFFVGVVLLFPHAILHEASVTFLGFGLSSEQPAIGVILSEAMRYLVTGQWWLAVFPGALLVAVVGLFYAAGENLRKLTQPGSVHE